jgi:L-alanine-DL-glutamate epimerase-like enolase superfamily enzyme
MARLASSIASADAKPEAPIRRITARAFRIPTDAPESDGTFAWAATTLVLVEIEAAGETGLGYTYADAACTGIVDGAIAKVLCGRDAFGIPALWETMVGAVRNLGWRGACACAISAVDIALWDLKAKLLDGPLVDLLGRARDEVPVYGSGGFTSYRLERLQEQLSGWVERERCRWVKMKVGTEPGEDLPRVRAARAAIGEAGLLSTPTAPMTASRRCTSPKISLSLA